MALDISLGDVLTPAVAVAFVLSIVANLLVARGKRRAAPLLVAMPVLTALLLVAGGLFLSIQEPFVGVPVAVGALLLLVAWLRSALALWRAVPSDESIEEFGLKIAERTYEPMALYGVLV